ncbi:hypothetical protein [Phenylobacterium sp.]|uniref:hypothetical protein n=1 Tax=Phenylobacterium sp. TaxID=1871053 RepID=UPI002F3FBE6C
MEHLFVQPAVWGFLGAFIYAGPRLSACIASPKEHGESPFACLVEFAIALIVGAIGAAAFAPWIIVSRGLTEARDLNAVAVLIGLMANPTAPTLISFAPRLASTVLAAMKGPKPDES